MNNTDIKITVKLSLKSSILSILGVFTLAKKIPITVTDNNPDSGCSESAPAKAKITKANERTLIKSEELNFLRSNVFKAHPENNPKKEPTQTVKKKVFNTI